MKKLLYIILVLLGLILIASIGAYLSRGRILAEILERQLTEAGVIDPRVTVSGATFDGVVLSLEGGRGDETIDADIKVSYDIQEAVREQRVGQIVITDARGTIFIEEDGAFRIAGIVPDFSSGSPSSPGEKLPFDSLVIESLDLTVVTPEGRAAIDGEGTLKGDLSGAFEIEGTTSTFGRTGMKLTDAAVAGDVSFTSTGEARATFSLKGDAALQGLTLNDMNLNAELDASGLQHGDLSRAIAMGRLEIIAATVSVPSNPILTSASEAPSDGAQDMTFVTLSGTAMASLVEGRLAMTTNANGLYATGEGGALVSLRPIDEVPIYSVDGEQSAIRTQLALSSQALAGNFRIEMDQTANGPIDFRLNGLAESAMLSGLTMSETDVDLAGTMLADKIDAQLTLDAKSLAYDAGSVFLDRAALNANLLIGADLTENSISVRSKNGECVIIPRIRISDQQSGELASLRSISMCPDAAPFFEIGGDAFAFGSDVRIARLQIPGDPILSFSDLDLEFAFEQTDTAALSIDIVNASGGYGDQLAISSIRGELGVVLDEDGPVGELLLSNLRLTDKADPIRFNPINANGPVNIDGEEITFNLRIADVRNNALGHLVGQHDLLHATGTLTFDSGMLTFVPGGFQPAQLVPALVGIVSKATGNAAVTVDLNWSPEGAQSGAVASLDNLTFQGPGLVVKETSGLTGTISLSSLAPITSAGPQSLSLNSIDLGAFKFERGTIDFEMPGNDTLTISNAKFPWFGGTIQASDTIVAFDGTTMALLEADDVEIAEALAILDLDGLTGEGRVEGTLPLRIDDFKIEVIDGRLQSTEPGVIRFTSQTTDAAAQSSEGAALAFDALEELHYDSLAATINGRLDGDLDFNFEFIGSSEMKLGGSRVKELVNAPVRLKANIQVPLLTLIDQARLSMDYRLQLERARQQAATE